MLLTDIVILNFFSSEVQVLQHTCKSLWDTLMYTDMRLLDNASMNYSFQRNHAKL